MDKNVPIIAFVMIECIYICVYRKLNYKNIDLMERDDLPVGIILLLSLPFTKVELFANMEIKYE